MRNKLQSLSFLIPAYNDTTTIAQAVREADAVGKRVANSHEILVIDDGSKDTTVEVLRSLSSSVPACSFSVHSRNRGYGATIKELYYKGKYQWMFSVPGDYQIGAEEVEKLMEKTDSADIILGLRTKRRDSWQRLLQSKIYNGLVRLLFGIKLHDINSVRLMKSDVMKNIRLTTDSAFVDAELVIRATNKGYRTIEVPIGHRAREGTVGGGGKWYVIQPVITDMIRFAWQRWFS